MSEQFQSLTFNKVAFYEGAKFRIAERASYEDAKRHNPYDKLGYENSWLYKSFMAGWNDADQAEHFRKLSGVWLAGDSAYEYRTKSPAQAAAQKAAEDFLDVAEKEPLIIRDLWSTYPKLMQKLLDKFLAAAIQWNADIKQCPNCAEEEAAFAANIAANRAAPLPAESKFSFDDYNRERIVLRTAQYPGYGNNIVYPAMGISGEAGELLDKIKKHWRNTTAELVKTDATAAGIIEAMSASMLTPEQREEILKEIGDVLWYCDALCDELGVKLKYAAKLNLRKLADRKQRNVILSAGDNR